MHFLLIWRYKVQCKPPERAGGLAKSRSPYLLQVLCSPHLHRHLTRAQERHSEHLPSAGLSCAVSWSASLSMASAPAVPGFPGWDWAFCSY